ncbi:MAG: UrcA family protein [Hyphomonadaceae bacterium]
MKLIKTSSSLTISAAMLGACAMLAFTPSSAFADVPQAAEENFEFNFHYAPSELKSADTADQMLERLESAVTRQCVGTSRVTLAERRMANDCVQETLESAVGKIGSRALADAYETRSAG